MKRSNLILVASILLPLSGALAQDAVPLDNIEIRMIRSSTNGPLRVTAETRNPNEFAVRDVQVKCVIKDKDGKDLTSYDTTIFDVFKANERKQTKNLNVGAWPPTGLVALCISSRAKRL